MKTTRRSFFALLATLAPSAWLARESSPAPEPPATSRSPRYIQSVVTVSGPATATATLEITATDEFGNSWPIKTTAIDHLIHWPGTAITVKGIP